MFIKELSVQNFKTFENLEFSFRNLNIVIGSNAAGKSNLISVLNFIRNITRHGLDNAVSMEGGIEYLRNRRINSSQNLSVSITYDADIRIGLDREKMLGLLISEEKYEFELKIMKSGKGYKVAKDMLTLKYNFIQVDEGENNSFRDKQILATTEAVLTNKNGKVVTSLNIPDEFKEYSETFLPSFIEYFDLQSNELMLESPIYTIVHRVENPLESIAIYDFDPKQPKKAVPITGKNELEEDGSNLSLVLRNIIQDKETKRKFINLISDLIPFVHDLNIQKFADKSLLFTVNERFLTQSDNLPASFISDGTVNIASIIIALYFSGNSPMIIEEPERNIHPHLISRLVTMLQEVSENKQIIATTHNPEIVRHAEIENILLMSRNEMGFSKISKPSENKEVRECFLSSRVSLENDQIRANLPDRPQVYRMDTD